MFPVIHNVVLDLVSGHGYGNRSRGYIDEVLIILPLKFDDSHYILRYKGQ